jgi:hypothetical protein
MIIAVSKAVHRSIKLQPPDAWPLELGEVLLYVLDKERYWNEPLARELRELIDKHDSSRVRVVAHRSGCFIDGTTPGIYQERRETEELSLRETFDRGETEVDVQVWAFHHETYSPLWNALQAVIVAVGDRALDDEGRQKLGDRLLDAFERVEVRGLLDQLTLYRHHILRPYTALRLDLQLAEEDGVGAEGGPWASDLSLRLERSSKTALDQFGQCSSYLGRLTSDPPAGVAAALTRVKSLLDEAPLEIGPCISAGLAGFEDWFRALDSSLEQLRAEFAP